MARKLVIGLGGTGLEVLRCLRRRIIEDYPDDGFRHFPGLGFLYIDTDPKEVEISEDNRKRWEVLGQSVQLTPAEHIIIQAPAIGRILENLSNYPQVRDWLPIHQLKGMDTAAKDTPGAQQIRALGRVIFTLESDRLRQRVAAIIDTLPADPTGGPTEIHVACSLSGGTGGGMFLDLAYSLRQWTNDYALTTGYLVMPDLNQEASRGRRYVANAYGALMDLNYFSLRARQVDGRDVPVCFHLPAEDVDITGQNPFDFCYLLGTRNQSKISLALGAIPDMISHRIYLTLDSMVVGDVAAMMNNGAMQRTRSLADPVNGNVFSQAFSTFGLSTIQYPTEQIVEIVSHRLAHALVQSWLKPAVVDNVNERVLQRLPDLSLIDDVFLGNRDIFQGANDFGSIPNDVERQLDEALAKLPADNRATELNRISSNFLEEFRGGLKRFYRTRDDNMEGAAQSLTRRVRTYALESIMDGDLGLPFALASVDDVIRLLSQKQQELSLRRGQVETKAQNSRGQVAAAIGQVTNAENTIFRRDSKLKEAMTRVKATLAFNLTSQVEERALEYGVKLVGRLGQTLAALRNELAEWGSAQAVVLSMLEREVGRRAESLEAMQKSSNQFNGAILFKAERVEQIYASLNEKEALQFMRDEVRQHGEALTIGRAEDGVDRLSRLAADWLTRLSAMRVAHKNVADQLLEDYPGAESAERRGVIAETYRRSAAFLEFDQGEIEIYRGQVGHAYESDGTTAIERAGMMDHDQNRHPSVVQIRKEISKATGLSPNAVSVISDTHQIIFMSERTAFPLRLVRDVRTLREAYRTQVAQKGSLPLLLQKAYHPPIGDLLLVSQDEVERLRRAEMNFLVGWTLGWIRYEQNNIENRQEARYRFFDAGAEQFVRVGDDREGALAYFTADSPDTAAVRKRLAEKVDRFGEKLDSYSSRAEFAEALDSLLRTMQGEIKYGEESPLYKRYNGIRQNVVTEYHLPDVAPKVTTPSAAPLTSDAEAKFRSFVGLFAAQARGGFTDKMLAVILTKQRALGVSDEQARGILASSSGAAAPTTPSDEYREMLTAMLEVGDLTEDAVIALVGFQADHGIRPEQAGQIEKEVRAKLGRPQ